MKIIILFVFLLFAQTTYAAQAMLSWQDNSTNETGFTIERQLNGGAWTVLVTALGANVVSFTDLTLVSSATVANVYCYRVKAFNADTQSGYTNTACKTIPQTGINAPSNLVVSSLSSSTLALSWADNSSDETLFEAERVQSKPPRTNFIILAANTTYYIDGGLRRNTGYSYRVRAVKSSGVSAWSNQASATTKR